MKKLLKISALSLALIASLLMINSTTNAAGGTGSATVKITAVTGTCAYATGLSVRTGSVSYTAHSETGSFTPSNWYCNDTEGLSGWTLTIQATTQLTGSITGSIPAANVYARADANTLTSGSCTVGTNQTTPVSISTQKTILNKASSSGQVCRIDAANVQLAVNIPASQAVGLYTGTLVIVSPW